MSNAAQKQEMLTPEEKINIFLAKEEGNLWVKWHKMSPQERNEWRKGLGAAERTLLWYAIQADCRKFVEEHEASQQAQPAKTNGAAKATKAQTRKKNKLDREWEKLSPEERAALEDQFNPKQLREAG